MPRRGGEKGSEAARSASSSAAAPAVDAAPLVPVSPEGASGSGEGRGAGGMEWRLAAAARRAPGAAGAFGAGTEEAVVAVWRGSRTASVRAAVAVRAGRGAASA